VDRTSLTIMYNSFIRPSLEYGNIVWCNCTDEDDEILESIQKRAARIITGAIVHTNSLCLFQEIGFESLRARREKHILTFFHKIVNGNAPNYLVDMVPPTPENRYNMRRQHNYPIPRCRITKYQNSFLPRAISLWNKMDNAMKAITDYDSFKRELDKKKPIENPLFHLGNREQNRIMARLRLNCSNLKGHLYDLKIIESPECQCGYGFEDSFHYLFVCPLYNGPRAILHNTVTNFASFTLRTVLFGRDSLNQHENTEIIKSTLKFISDSKRFET